LVKRNIEPGRSFKYTLKANYKSPEYFMKRAIQEAKKAYNKGEVPVGAVVVKHNTIIGRGYNQKELKEDTTLHAEILAIRKASRKISSWRLYDCDLYVTLEPCPMCAGAIINARIRKVFFGALDPKAGAVGSILNLFDYKKFNHNVEYQGEILKSDCEIIIKNFFKELRNGLIVTKRNS